MELKYYILTTQQDGCFSSHTKLFHGNLVKYLYLNKIAGVRASIVFALEITKEEYDYYYND